MALAPVLNKLVSPQALCMFWAGTSFAIDVEAVVKFRAPTIKREQAFDVGRHVFAAQSHVESALALATIAAAYSGNGTPFHTYALYTGIAAHAIQKFVFLPLLTERAGRIINGEKIEKSPVHVVYLFVEAVKLDQEENLEVPILRYGQAAHNLADWISESQ